MKILIGLLLLSLIGCGQVRNEGGHLDRVKDSDTFVIDGKTIRLADCDGPETGQEYGDSAKLFSERFLKGGKIEVVEKERDKYGRTVAWVYVNGESLSERLVVVGLAWAYRRFSPAYLYDQMQIAKEKKIGLWKGAPVAPYVFRKLNQKQ